MDGRTSRTVTRPKAGSRATRAGDEDEGWRGQPVDRTARPARTERQTSRTDVEGERGRCREAGGFHQGLSFVQSSRIFSNKLNIRGLPMDHEIMTIKDLAVYLKIKEKTAYRLAAEGKIPGFKVGGSWRFRQRDIESWIEAQSCDRSNEK